MAENLVVNGVAYNGVDSVAMQNENGETVFYFLDEKNSVKAYGAVGDGSADDTTAFLTALAEKRTVFVPGGTYKLSDTLVIRENCGLELSQDTILQFTKTSGNCIEMRGSAVLRGNHGNIDVSSSFTGNVISVDTGLDGVNHSSIPPYMKSTPMWKRQRFIHDVNITRTEGNFQGSLSGGHSGTALYVSANYETTEPYDGQNTAPITFIWAMSVSGLRIAGAFDYGINIQNRDTTASGYGNSEDPAWNHDMRIEAVIVGCETGVRVFNCNTAHLDVTVQPTVSINKVSGANVKYAKNGIVLEHSNDIDLSQSIVWDWNVKNTLVDTNERYKPIALIGVCEGVILSDFTFNVSSGVRNRVYTDTESNLESLIVLQEPITRWFKTIGGVPYFYDGVSNKKLMLNTEKFSAEQTEFIRSADGYYTYDPNYTNLASGYQDGCYLLENGTLNSIADQYTTTDFIPIDPATAHTYRIGGEGIVWKDSYQYGRIAWYDADKKIIGSACSWNKIGSSVYYPEWVEDESVAAAFVTLPTQSMHGKAHYFRITARGKGENLIVTVDEKQETNAIWHGEPRRIDESVYAQNVFLKSPNGTGFRLVVNNDGTLGTEPME